MVFNAMKMSIFYITNAQVTEHKCNNPDSFTNQNRLFKSTEKFRRLIKWDFEGVNILWHIWKVPEHTHTGAQFLSKSLGAIYFFRLMLSTFTWNDCPSQNILINFMSLIRCAGNFKLTRNEISFLRDCTVFFCRWMCVGGRLLWQCIVCMCWFPNWNLALVHLKWINKGYRLSVCASNVPRWMAWNVTTLGYFQVYLFSHSSLPILGKYIYEMLVFPICKPITPVGTIRMCSIPMPRNTKITSKLMRSIQF